MYVNMYIIDVCIQLHTCRRTSKWESCSTCSRVQLFNFAVRIKSRLAASLPFTVTATVKKKTATRVMTWLIAPFKSSSGWWFGGLEHGFYFPYYMGCHPSHWLIFFREVETTNQSWSGYFQRHFGSKLWYLVDPSFGWSSQFRWFSLGRSLILSDKFGW